MCGGSFMSGIAPQINSALGGGANPLQGSGGGTGGGLMGGGMPAPMQNPFLGGSSGGGMSQPMPAGWEPKLSSVNTTTEQDILRGRPGMTTPAPSMPPAPQGPGAGISPEMLQKLLQGTPSGANGPYPALVSALPFQPPQISSQQQRFMDKFNSKMQPYQQQMDQLQQQYMGQPPQALQQMQQQMQQTPEFQAIQKAMQSGNFAEANRLQQAFEASPQFQQMQKEGEAFRQQQQQAFQKMQADPRFQQLQRQMDKYQQLQQRQMQRFMPQIPRGADDTYMPRPQVLPAQPRQQVLPSQSLGAGIANLLPGLMF